MNLIRKLWYTWHFSRAYSVNKMCDKILAFYKKNPNTAPSERDLAIWDEGFSLNNKTFNQSMGKLRNFDMISETLDNPPRYRITKDGLYMIEFGGWISHLKHKRLAIKHANNQHRWYIVSILIGATGAAMGVYKTFIEPEKANKKSIQGLSTRLDSLSDIIDIRNHIGTNPTDSLPGQIQKK